MLLESKMKVILSSRAVMPFHPFGGMEKYVHYLGKHLSQEGVDVEVVASSHKRDSKILSGVKYSLITPWVTLGVLHAPMYQIFNKNLSTFLSRRSFDVLHSYEITSHNYLSFEGRSPTVVQAFDNEPCKVKGYKRYYFYPIARKLSYCMTHCDAIASEGEFQHGEIMELFGVDREKIFELPVGVDISLIKDILEEGDLTREDLGLKEEDYVVISVNRLKPVKGIEYLIKAFNLIKNELDNAKLILIGEGTEEQRLMKMTTNFGLKDSVLHFRSVCERDLYQYYHLSDVYASPTLQDTSIMGILEAMACGLPIVSTGQRWVVLNGENGYIVSKKNPQELAKAILKIHEKNLSRTMSAVSQKIIWEYDWKSITKKAIGEYEKLTSRM